MNDLANRLDLIYKERPDLDGDRGQTGFVKASGASKSVVNQWMNGGIKKMAIEYAMEIERTLGYSHVWLMTGRGEPKAVGGVVFIEVPAAERRHIQWVGDDEAEILDAYRATDDIGRDRIRTAAESVPKDLLSGVARNKA